MKKAYLFFATGFEEMEAIGTVDVLRRGGIDTKMVSITGERAVTGAHGIVIVTDSLLADTPLTDADALVLPGGMPGATNLNNCEPLKEQLLEQYRNNKTIAAICAAPLVLGGLGLLKGRRATCYPGFEPKLIGAITTGNDVEVDDHIITGKGPGLVYDFALVIIAALRGRGVADEVAGGLLL